MLGLPYSKYVKICFSTFFCLFWNCILNVHINIDTEHYLQMQLFKKSKGNAAQIGPTWSLFLCKALETPMLCSMPGSFEKAEEIPNFYLL